MERALTDGLRREIFEVVEDLKRYVDGGVPVGEPPPEGEPSFEEVSREKFTSLASSKPKGRMLSVDASFYPLLSGNYWRVGVSRCAYVVVEVQAGRPIVVDEGFEDHVFGVVCPPARRLYEIWSRLRRFESELALQALKSLNLGERDFCLLDGAAYFGGAKNFLLDLYEEAKRRRVRMVTIPKRSLRLLDGQGRDLLASLSLTGERLCRDGSLRETWIYYPVRVGRVRGLRLYAKVSAVKLSPSSSRVFRCDFVDYMVEGESVVQAASELAYLSRDARCDGYPAPLYLAHRWTHIPEPKLIEYEEEVYRSLEEKGLLEELLREAEAASFRRVLLGLSHDYQLGEEIVDY
ncbi:MAG: hypothetical protein DRO52_02560 [Candidatus Hecatellales archaeon]|nr:MAG: hypothetical protein DRO52_02560 [Candidatus Hecatellales archaeon]